MNNAETIETVFVTGGAGYVGSRLIPRLLEEGYRVKVLDLYIYGEQIFRNWHDNENLEEIKGDIRDQNLLKEKLAGCDAVIHLACISNDPSFELNPELSRTINYDAFEPLVSISRSNGVKRFIYASSASVYGVSDAPEVTEDHPLVPITEYNKYKARCETVLFSHQSSNFTTVAIRPATVCGYAPRQRFDLTVNILTNHAVNNGKILVFGGQQKRPNLHIQDMVDLYVQLLQEDDIRIAGKAFNAGNQNHAISEIAEIVRAVVQKQLPDKQGIDIATTSSDDIRSYHISSERIRRELEFVPKRTIQDAAGELCRALVEGSFNEPMSNPLYYNIKRMQEIALH